MNIDTDKKIIITSEEDVKNYMDEYYFIINYVENMKKKIRDYMKENNISSIESEFSKCYFLSVENCYIPENIIDIIKEKNLELPPMVPDQNYIKVYYKDLCKIVKQERFNITKK